MLKATILPDNRDFAIQTVKVWDIAAGNKTVQICDKHGSDTVIENDINPIADTLDDDHCLPQAETMTITMSKYHGIIQS